MWVGSPAFIEQLKLPMNLNGFSLLSVAVKWMCVVAVSAWSLRADDRLVGVWMIDDGWQITELLFRSDGRYQLDTRNTDPTMDLSSSERGRYEASGGQLFLTPYDFIGEPLSRAYVFQFNGDLLSLTRTDF